MSTLACARALQRIPPPRGEFMGKLGGELGEIQNLFICMSLVHKIQTVLQPLRPDAKVKASVPRNELVVLTVTRCRHQGGHRSCSLPPGCF